MEEWKDYYGYKVSNYGKVVNRFGKEVKGYISKDRGYEYRVIVLRIDKVRKHLHFNTLVYRLFNTDYQDGAKVYHLDGNINNCAVDNLKISRAYTTNPTTEQIEIYKSQVINCVKHYFKIQGWFEAQKQGIDIDNALGNAYLLIWKYLPSFRVGTSFYSFSTKFCRIAFLYQYKQDIRFRKLKEQK